METIQLHIISPEQSIFKGKVQKVNLPGTVAPFTILPRHAPIISSLVSGAILFTTEEGKDMQVELEGGFVEMSNGTVTVCIC